MPKKNFIILTRHGESQYNVYGKIGGDSNLSLKGEKYANALSLYINSYDFDENLTCWTSGLKRTIQTASGIKCNRRLVFQDLNELQGGLYDDLTYSEIEEKYPKEFASRDENKLEYRYPGGESYLDVLKRVSPFVEEIKDFEGNLLIVSHQAVLRCLLGKLLQKPEKDIPYISIPLHTVIWMTRTGEDKWEVANVRFPVSCMDNAQWGKPKASAQHRTMEESLNTINGY